MIDCTGALVRGRLNKLQWLMGTVLLLSSGLRASSLPTDPIQQAVVETVTKGSEAERAGLHEGDIIQSWKRGEAHGDIQSPLDLHIVEIEQSPRGPVTLGGFSGTAEQAWTLGPSRWGLETRAEIPEDLLPGYRDGQELAKKGRFAEAAERWTMIAIGASRSRPGRLSPWLLYYAAKSLANAHQWKQADDAYRRSVQQAADSGPIVMCLLLRAWALTYQQRGDWPNAEKYYRQALADSRRSGPESLLTAACLFALGEGFRLHSDFAKAEEYLGQSLEVRRKQAPASLAVASSLNSLGLIAEDRGNLDNAEHYLTEALEIRQQQAPDSLDVAASLNNLGLLVEDRGDLDKAEAYHGRALVIKAELAPESLDAAYTFSSLGNLAFERGDLSKAEGYMRRALAIRKKLAPDGPEIATNLGNLGNVGWQRGDLGAADEYYREALAIEQKFAPGSLDAANILDNLGNVALSQRDLAKAGKYHGQALQIRKKLAPFSLDISHSFDNLGGLAEEEGDLEGAARYYRHALTIQEKLAPASLIVAVSLSNLGTVAEKRGNLVAADEYYLRALAIEKKLAPVSLDTSENLRRRGDVARDRKDLVLAEDLYRQALAIQEKLAPESVQYAESLAALGSVMRRAGRFNDASQLLNQSLNALESQIERLDATDEARADFRARYASYYLEYVDLSMAQERPELAFHIAERLRARTLLETLAAARVDIHKGADPKLIERERSLQDSLKAKSDRRVLLLTGKHTNEQVEAVENEIEELRTEFQQVESRIRASSPVYAALTHPQPLTVKEVQELLDEDTVLLEYSLGEERSYLWAVTSRTFTAYELPARRIIETTARRLYRLVSALRYSGPTQKRQRQALLRMAARRMSQLVLGPILGQLQNKRLLIVADGALQYIPFALLPEPGKLDGGPLLLSHEIVSSPSASVLSELRHQGVGRKQAPKAVAVLADPVFSSEDPRVKAGGRSPGRASTKRPPRETDPLREQHLSRSAADVGLLHLPRLAFSRREADAIMALTPTGQGLEAVGFAASRPTATSNELTQYRIVHYATHGLSDSRHPQFSGLVMSLVDQRGRPQNGFLDLQDIYNLDLPAELVVLSACETALGKEIQGEGLLGLTRGFMYAGAARVVASLWNVDDVATKELMENFYRAIEHDGMRPAAALRTAQIAMWKQQRWKDPYYWATFQIQGEWK